MKRNLPIVIIEEGTNLPIDVQAIAANVFTVSNSGEISHTKARNTTPIGEEALLSPVWHLVNVLDQMSNMTELARLARMLREKRDD